jgi:2-oxoglutarate ferredoxin oxidoreductase subunit beta
VQALQSRGEIVTGLLYVAADAPALHDALNTSQAPLNTLDERALCPGIDVLDKINASLR